MQIGFALANLLRLRIAIARRPALDDVRNIDVCSALEPDRCQHVVEQFTGLPDKRVAEPVFIRARTFADEQPFGTFVADAKHGLVTALVQWACGTSAHTRLE